MEYINESLEIKNKVRQVDYCYDLNLYKRRRTFSGIRCLDKWKILNGYIDLNKKLNCLEIGSHEGQSSTYFLKYILKNPESKLVCVDPWYKSSWGRTDNSIVDYEDIFDLNKSNNDFNHQLCKYSGLNVDYYKSDMYNNTEIDIAYIDDNHTYESTKLNLEKIYDKLKVGGIIILDDYDATYKDPNDKNAGFHWTDPVKKAVDDFIKKIDMKIIFKEYQIILLK